VEAFFELKKATDDYFPDEPEAGIDKGTGCQLYRGV
jgi:hypothetical protein